MSAGLRYEVTRDADGAVSIYYPADRKTVRLGILTDEEIPAAAAALDQLPGPRAVAEWDAARERKRAQNAGEPAVEDIVAGWYAQGTDGQSR